VARIQSEAVGGVHHVWEKVPNKAAKQRLRSPFMGEIAVTEAQLIHRAIWKGQLGDLIDRFDINDVFKTAVGNVDRSWIEEKVLEVTMYQRNRWFGWHCFP
jgi:hypothetical protein